MEKTAWRGGQIVACGHLLARAVPALGSNADSVKVPLKSLNCVHQ